MADIIIDQNSREYKAAMDLETALNSFSWNPKMFAVSTQHMHRTLQQTLFRTMVETMKVYAKMNTDLRNQASKEGAEKILQVLNETYAPFI